MHNIFELFNKKTINQEQNCSFHIYYWQCTTVRLKIEEVCKAYGGYSSYTLFKLRHFSHKFVRIIKICMKTLKSYGWLSLNSSQNVLRRTILMVMNEKVLIVQQ